MPRRCVHEDESRRVRRERDIALVSRSLGLEEELGVRRVRGMEGGGQTTLSTTQSYSRDSHS
jgi:hypothetical protein